MIAERPRAAIDLEVIEPGDEVVLESAGESVKGLSMTLQGREKAIRAFETPIVYARWRSGLNRWVAVPGVKIRSHQGRLL